MFQAKAVVNFLANDFRGEGKVFVTSVKVGAIIGGTWGGFEIAKHLIDYDLKNPNLISIGPIFFHGMITCFTAALSTIPGAASGALTSVVGSIVTAVGATVYGVAGGATKLTGDLISYATRPNDQGGPGPSPKQRKLG